MLTFISPTKNPQEQGVIQSFLFVTGLEFANSWENLQENNVRVRPQYYKLNMLDRKGQTLLRQAKAGGHLTMPPITGGW